MDRATFRDLLRALPEAALAGAQAADGRAITPAMLARGGFTLHAIAPGRYRLRWGGYDVLDAARPGQAFVLDLNGLSPVPPTATSPTRQPARPTSPRAAVRQIEGWDDDE
ncbi:MAG: hypothetical protein RMK90_14270 [Acetobacteraceae bacterium]|nr:hypothetical protein [Acetobacteraceae bacterium]